MRKALQGIIINNNYDYYRFKIGNYRYNLANKGKIGGREEGLTLETNEKAKPEEKQYPPMSDGPSFFSSSQIDSVPSDLIHRLVEKVADLTLAMEKMNMAEYLQLFNRPMRLLYINFIAGMARGFGFAVGFALLGAILVYLLQKLVVLNLPVIGNFIADIVQMVQYQVQARH